MRHSVHSLGQSAWTCVVHVYMERCSHIQNSAPDALCRRSHARICFSPGIPVMNMFHPWDGPYDSV